MTGNRGADGHLLDISSNSTDWIDDVVDYIQTTPPGGAVASDRHVIASLGNNVIDVATIATHQFECNAVDLTAVIVAGDIIRVRGANGNVGWYTVVTSTLVGGVDTHIVVSEAVPSAVAGDFIHWSDTATDWGTIGVDRVTVYSGTTWSLASTPTYGTTALSQATDEFIVFSGQLWALWAATVDHTALTNLVAGDAGHTQFLLLAGGTMTGAINHATSMDFTIATIDRTLLTATTYTNQTAAATNILYLDTYSTTNNHTPVIRLRKSDNNTLGTVTQTDNGESLGIIDFRGVDNGSNFDRGAIIKAVQNGVSNTTVPTDLSIETYSATVINASQFVLRGAGAIELLTSNASQDIILTTGGATSDIIADSTRLIELDAGVNVEQHIAGVQRIATTATTYNNKVGSDYNYTTLETYSATDSEITILRLTKSHVDTLDTQVATIDTEIAGLIEFQGVNNVPAKYTIGEIVCRQVGNTDAALGGQVVINGATRTGALNTDQIVAHDDNTVSLLAGAWDFNATVLLPGTTSSLQLGNATAVFTDLYIEGIWMYDATGAEAAFMGRDLTKLLIDANGAGGVALMELNADPSIALQIGTATELLVSVNSLLITSASQLEFGAATRYLVDSGTDIHLGLAAGDMFGPATTSSIDLGDATHVYQTLFTEVVNFYDTTAAENASIARSLTDFTLNAGTGATLSLQIAGGTELLIDTNSLLVTSASQLQFGATTRYITDDGTSLIIKSTNSTTRDSPEVQTSDATVTTLDSVTLDDNHAYKVEVCTLAMESDGSDRNYYHLEGLFYRDGAGAVQQGGTTSITTIESEAACDCVFDVNGNDVRVRVTGVVAETWNWTGKMDITEVD